MKVSTDPPVDPDLIEPTPTRATTGLLVWILRLVAAVAIPVGTFTVLLWSFNFLRDERANRFLVVGVAIVVGVGGVFLLYWAMNRAVDLFPAVLREGVANLLEHSDAERCDIIMRQRDDRVSLDIINDGVDETLARSGAFKGSGLNTLARTGSRSSGTGSSRLSGSRWRWVA